MTKKPSVGLMDAADLKHSAVIKNIYINAKIFICIVLAGTSKSSMSFGFLHVTALALALALALV